MISNKFEKLQIFRVIITTKMFEGKDDLFVINFMMILISQWAA